MKKRINILLAGIAMLIASLPVQGQELTKTNNPTCIVLNIDAQSINLESKQMGNLVRMELEKLKKYEVVDRYDVAYLVEKNNLNIDNCYGKICLLEIGNKLEVEYMFTGSVEKFGEIIVMTMRLIDVKAGTIVKTEVMEFQNYPKEIQSMVGLCIAKLFDLETNSELERYLTKKNDYENTLNNPDITQLNLSGPRMGISFLTGENAAIMKADPEEGGFDNYPFFTSFGYQFEIQYLNEGNFQALFEIIPLVSGLDQGRIIPSINFLHGVRNNKNGLEFAFGPTLSSYQYATGYHDSDGIWVLEKDWLSTRPGIDVPAILEKRLDGRGENYGIRPGFIFAGGYTFKSGKLNLPINLFVIPSKRNTRFGISMGFNAKR